MELKRKVAMVAATLTVALGAGHLMQNGLGVQQGRVASVASPTSENPAETPKEIVPLAAGLGAMPDGVATDPAPAPVLPETAFAPTQVVPGPKAAAPELTETPTPDISLSGDSTNCPVTLEVMASAQATLDLTLLAPCRASERVVIRHGGLTVTGMTSLTGTMFTSIPGMDQAGDVTLLFGDGMEVSAAESLPDLPLYRRVAVQWMADDAFQLNAFENNAKFGEAGHISAANPQRRLPNVPLKGGYMSLLGDGTASLPMLAEVYTFPLDPAESVDLTIEASVTDATCDRELLGEVLLSEGGLVQKTDLTMATPTCDAIGDVLVLNNPLPDLKLAVAN